MFRTTRDDDSRCCRQRGPSSNKSPSPYSTIKYIVNFFYSKFIYYHWHVLPPVTRHNGSMSVHQPSKMPLIEFLSLDFNSACRTVLNSLQCKDFRTVQQANLYHAEASCFIHSKWHRIQFRRVGCLLTLLATIEISVHASRVLACMPAYRCPWLVLKRKKIIV